MAATSSTKAASNASSSNGELPTLARVLGDANQILHDNPGPYTAEATLYRASAHRERAVAFAAAGVLYGISTRFRWPQKPWQRIAGSWILGLPIGASFDAYRRSSDLKWQLHLARSSKLETICPYMPAYATKYAVAQAAEGPSSPQLSEGDYVIFKAYQPVCDAFATGMRAKGLRASWDKEKKQQ